MKFKGFIVLLIIFTAPIIKPQFDNMKIVDLTYAFDESTIYWPTADGFKLEFAIINKSNSNHFKENKNLVLENKKKKIITNPKVSIQFMKWEGNCDLANIDFDRVYLPIDFFINSEYNELETIKNSNKKVYFYFPQITKEKFYSLFDTYIMPLLNENKIDGVMISNISQYEKVKNIKTSIHGNYTLNIFNNESINLLNSLNFGSFTYSVELNKNQIKNMNAAIESEIVVYGNLPMMVMEHCLYKECKDCSKKNIELVDRLGYSFKVVKDCINCVNYILNAKILYLVKEFDIIKKMNTDFCRIMVLDESENEIIKIISTLKQTDKSIKTKYDQNNITKGHLNRGV